MLIINAAWEIAKGEPQLHVSLEGESIAHSKNHPFLFNYAVHLSNLLPYILFASDKRVRKALKSPSGVKMTHSRILLDADEEKMDIWLDILDDVLLTLIAHESKVRNVVRMEIENRIREDISNRLR